MLATHFDQLRLHCVALALHASHLHRECDFCEAVEALEKFHCVLFVTVSCYERLLDPQGHDMRNPLNEFLLSRSQGHAGRGSLHAVACTQARREGVLACC